MTPWLLTVRVLQDIHGILPPLPYTSLALVIAIAILIYEARSLLGSRARAERRAERIREASLRATRADALMSLRPLVTAKAGASGEIFATTTPAPLAATPPATPSRPHDEMPAAARAVRQGETLAVGTSPDAAVERAVEPAPPQLASLPRMPYGAQRTQRHDAGVNRAFALWLMMLAAAYVILTRRSRGSES